MEGFFKSYDSFDQNFDTGLGSHSIIAFDFVGSVLVEETEGQLGT